jgi:hypothetical protein
MLPEFVNEPQEGAIMTNKRHSGWAITLSAGLVFFNLTAIEARPRTEATAPHSQETPPRRDDNLTNSTATPSQLVNGAEPQPGPESPSVPASPALEAAKENAAAEELANVKALPSLQPLALPDFAKLSLVDKAYLDAYAILRDNNACSRFYGGFAAIEVLNELTRQLKPVHLNKSIALRMTGKFSSAMNQMTKLSYRVFEKAQLNANGSFYKTNLFPTDSAIPRLGEFSPNTREARLTILLHELGHMIKGPGGEWLLPNDGDDPATSRGNTQKVIDVCRAQIISRSHITFDAALALLQSDRHANSARVAVHSETTPPQNSVTKHIGDDLLRQIGSQLDARCETCRREIQNPQDR